METQVAALLGSFSVPAMHTKYSDAFNGRVITVKSRNVLHEDFSV